MVSRLSKVVCDLATAILLCLCLFTQAQASSVTSPSFDDVVQIAVTELPFSFSPFASSSAVISLFPLLPDIDRGSSSQYSHLFFDPLVRWGQTKKLEYRLITRLEKLENGDTRFYLKKGIEFHSGSLLTSKDVIWSLDEALKNKNLHRKLQHIIQIKPINDHQFDIQTQLTQEQLLDYLSHLFILDSEFYKANKIDHNAMQVALSAPIETIPLSGTGPYQVTSFYSGVSLRVQASTTYWQDQPMLKSLNFVKVKSKESRLYALLAGDIDISEAVANENIDSVHLLDNKKIHQTASTNAMFLLMNEYSNGTFEDDSVRNAIHLAINQAGMLKHILNGTGTVGNTFANTTFEHDNHLSKQAPLNQKSDEVKTPSKVSTLKEPLYDTKLAKLLLNTLITPKRVSMLVLVDENAHTKEAVEAITNMLLKVGLQLWVTEVETLAGWNKYQFEHDLLLANWHTTLLNSDNIYQNIFKNSPLSAYLSLRFNQEEQPLSLQQKIKLFDQYQSQDFVVPLFSQNEVWATDQKFDLKDVFSVNAIPYWHQLTLSADKENH
jgi:peptide/nickel transport system substrate-binding protein